MVKPKTCVKTVKTVKTLPCMLAIQALTQTGLVKTIVTRTTA